MPATFSTLRVADVNADGKLDVVLLVADPTGNGHLYIMLGDGTGHFTQKAVYAIATPGSLAVEDLNGDGKLDIVVSLGINGAEIFHGNGDGTFSIGGTVSIYGAIFRAVVAGNLTGDGRKQFAAVDWLPGRAWIYEYSSTLNSYNTVGMVSVGVAGYTITTADLNGDGISDLIGSYALPGFSVILGGSTAAAHYPTPISVAGDPAIITGDINGDGHPDVIVSAADHVAAYKGVGNGSLTGPDVYTSGVPLSLATADFDGDGHADVALTNGSLSWPNLSSTVTVLYGTGNFAAPLFGAPASYYVGTPPRAIGAGDFNGDGRPDIVAFTEMFNDLVVLLSTCSPAPTASSISPSIGPMAGGTTVTVSGANFAGAAVVTVGGARATIVSKSDTSITITTPPGRGSAQVVVSTAGGDVTVPGSFTYEPPPTITGISPSSGSTLGTNVRIDGSDFTGVTSVTFDGVAGTGLALAGGSINVTAPAHAAGTVNVVVTTPGGTGSTAFTYLALPTITSVVPSSGPLTGSQTVTISGTNLDTETLVKFGSATAGVGLVTATALLVVPPAGSAGHVDVAVTTAAGTATLTNGYTYTAAPVINSISPAHGLTIGGNSVTITGYQFGSSPAVTFNGVAATGITSNGSTITLTTPPGPAGNATVTVTTANGSASTSFTYATNMWASINASRGPAAGGASVTIYGGGLTASTVTFGGTPAAKTFNDDANVILTTPPHAAGTVDVVVTDSNGTITLSGAYTFVNAPTISNIDPAIGPSSGGPSVVLTGTNFDADPANTSVSFGGTTTTFTINSATSITARSPGGTAGAQSVAVTTSGGTATTTYTFVDPPVVTGVVPSSGQLAGGDHIVLNGMNLDRTTSVIFDSTAAAFTVNSPTQLAVTTPPGILGNSIIFVTTPGGGSSGVFTYLPQPAIVDVSPSSSATTGGQSVTITGTDIGNATALTFGGVSAPITTNSATSITTTAPAGTAGAASIVLTNAGGTATAPFTYVAAPTISGVTPASGPATGGDSITISGTNLDATASVTVGGAAASIARQQSGSIIAVTPAGTPGGASVVVTTVGGSASGSYTYVAAPTIGTVTPTAGPAAGGNSIVITGANLSGATVTIGGSAATVVTPGSTSITATAPAHAAGTFDVLVTTVGGSATAAAAYTFVPAPAVSSVSPSAGPLGASAGVVISGSNMGGATGVTFGGTAAAITANTTTAVTVTAPAHGAGAVDVSVTTIGGTGTLASAYTYTPAPVITSVAPNAGAITGGQSVTISGSNLGGATTVTLGGLPAVITANAQGSITITTPAHTAGAVDVVVTTIGGSATSTNAYTYTSAPVINSVQPPVGRIAGGQTVVINGSNLAAATSVAFGGIMVTPTSNTDSSITLTTPPHAPGAVDVVVTTAGGVVTMPSAFRYIAFDPNGDGVVTVADVFYLINYLFTGAAPPVGSGDANNDGTVTVADIFFTINYFFANGPAPH